MSRGTVVDILKLRDSFIKYQQLCNDEKEMKSDKWYALLDKTGWPYHILCAIGTANTVIRFLTNGNSVLVCSQLGSDRTPLVVGLALILIDPYYRTMEGFRVLIEREFLSFGHQFRTRLRNAPKGQTNIPNEKVYIPIFFMFLDGVYQIMAQAPLAFEFNLRYLKKIAVHASSLKFGTFLCDNEKEREMLGVQENTISLWSYLEQYNKREKYLNMFYNKENAKGCLFIVPIAVRSYIWTAFYSRWTPSKVTHFKEYPKEM